MCHSAARNAVVEHVEHEVRVYPVARTRQLELHNTNAVAQHLLAAVRHPQGEEQSEGDHGKGKSHRHEVGTVDVGVFLFHSERVMESQRVLREAVHDFRRTHVAAVVEQRVGLVVVLFHDVVGAAVVASAHIVVAEVAIAYVPHVIHRHEVGTFGGEQTLHCRHVTIAQRQSHLYGVEIIDGGRVVHLYEIRFDKGKTTLRFCRHAEVEIDVGKIETTQVHVEVGVHVALDEHLFQLPELRERRAVVV